MTPPNNPSLTHRLSISREFDAPCELVWRAWTDPAQVKQWLGPADDMTVESVTMDLRVGGQFRIQTRQTDGEYYTAAGTYLEVQPPERLVYTWDWEKDGGGEAFGELEGRETQVTIELRARGARTELTLTHEKFEEPTRRDRHQEGWQIWLGRLAKYLEAH